VGRELVKSLGTAWAIVGLLLMVAGLGLYYHEETESALYGTVVTRPYEDTGDKMYYVGFALLILAIIVYLAGLLLKPSISEILKAERLVKENQARLRAYRERTGPDATGNLWQD
jgi:hypothetical protein